MKFIEPLGQVGRKKRYYQYTAIDDCTRLRVLRAYPRNDQKTAIQFIDHVLSKLPFQVEQVQTDNGARVRASIPLAPARQRHRPRQDPAPPTASEGKVEDRTASTPKSSTASSKAR